MHVCFSVNFLKLFITAFFQYTCKPLPLVLIEYLENLTINHDLGKHLKILSIIIDFVENINHVPKAILKKLFFALLLQRKYALGTRLRKYLKIWRSVETIIKPYLEHDIVQETYFFLKMICINESHWLYNLQICTVCKSHIELVTRSWKYR